MKQDYAQMVYDTVNGVLIQAEQVPEVENEFESGKPCMNRYEKMLDAYARLRERLGVTDEDDDVEIIISALLENGYDIGMKMYQYGERFAEI